jgi:hypothetical protein
MDADVAAAQIHVGHLPKSETDWQDRTVAFIVDHYVGLSLEEIMATIQRVGWCCSSVGPRPR